MNLTPAQTAAADQFHAGTNETLDRVLTIARQTMAAEDMSEPAATATLALFLRGMVKSDPDGVAALLAVAVIRLAKEGE